jgi:hypothetical protein
MAVPPDESETDVSMLEVVASDSIVATLQTTMEHGQSILVTDYRHQEEFMTRPSRESVLQRLSEALLRHSLSKVRFVVSVSVAHLNLAPLSKQSWEQERIAVSSYMML